MTGSTTPAGEAMREAVAQWLESEVGLYVSDAAEKAGEFCGPSGPIASELARLTAERDEARRRHAITEAEACSRAADAGQSEKHRNDLMDAIVSLKTERGALRSHLAAAEAALTSLRAEHAAAVANAREPVGDAWDEVRRLEAECRVFIRERDEWKAVADHERAEHAAEVARKDEEIARLREALKQAAADHDTVANHADPYDDAAGTKDHSLLQDIEQMAGSAGERARLALATTETTDA